MITDYLENGVKFIYNEKDWNYQIRYLYQKDYYCILWSATGQNIFIGHMKHYADVLEKVLQFERGESDFKTIRELHHFAFKALGYSGEPQ